MSKLKATPGPWKIVEHSWSDTGIYIGDERIALLSVYGTTTEATQDARAVEMGANASLIVAAHKMYAALEMVRDADDDCIRDNLETIPQAARAKIDAALAKARGEA